MSFFGLFKRQKELAVEPVDDQLDVDNPEVVTDSYIDAVPDSVPEQAEHEPDFSDDPDAPLSATVDQTPGDENLAQVTYRVALGHVNVNTALNWFRSQIGYHEGPNNYNKYAAVAGQANNEPWCDTFMCAGFKTVGQTVPVFSAYTPTSEAGYKAAGRLGIEPRVGAQFFYYSTTAGRIDHTGIVESINDHDGTVTTIEGNYGDAVRRNVRAKLRRGGSGIASYGYPEYSAVAPVPAPKPTPGHKPVGVVVALQKDVRVPADGDWGPQTDLALRVVLGLANASVKYHQARVGTTVDGIWGPKSRAASVATIKRVQGHMGKLVVDGISGPKTKARFAEYHKAYYGKY